MASEVPALARVRRSARHYYSPPAAEPQLMLSNSRLVSASRLCFVQSGPRNGNQRPTERRTTLSRITDNGALGRVLLLRHWG